MLALLRTRRWISFTALVLLVIIGFGLLSRWQWSRAETKRTERVALETASVVTPSRLPSSSVLSGTSEWTRFTASGSFDQHHQVVVRKRPLSGTNGFWVMTPLITDDHRTIWVNRGWMPVQGIATSMPTIPQPPSGQQLITGAWRTYEAAQTTDLTGLPVGMIPAPAPEVLPIQGSVPGYLQLTDPKQSGLELVDTPEIDEGQNVSYAVQWILFALVAIIGWFIFLRREAADDARNAKSNPGSTQL